MKTPSSPLRTSPRAVYSDSEVARKEDARLGGRFLTFARAAWILLTVLVIGLTIAALPVQYEQLPTPCSDASCANGQLPREAVQAMEERGLFIASYALYGIARDVVFVSVWLAVASLIFWRRASDQAALVVSVFLVTFGVGTFTDTLNSLTRW